MSIRSTIPLAATVALTALMLTGCNADEGDAAPKDGGAAASAAATSAGPAGTPESTAAAVVYQDPMDIAKKIRKARLGCAKPAKTESLGSGKVICGGADNISIEFYDDPQAFTEVKKVICQMNSSSTIVADEGRHWMVTTLSNGTTKRVQQVVGGKVVKAC
ncbi:MULTISPECIES: hypothetical protein [unclassified Actinomadura]|uniref:hypothetical protein n=1 Tax=unclassified Actinomadura TaxID=2626254 RepID=UPI0011ECA5FB|nr:hypothetical protein [Actinomadura sp. K4S16]